MKRTLAFLLTLLCLGVPALAADSGYRLEANELGLRIVIDEGWMDAVGGGTLQLWLRSDADVMKDGVLGYALLYEVGDIDGFMADTYGEAESWLNEHCTLVGGAVAHEQGTKGVDALYADLAHTELGEVGDTSYTLIRPAQAPGSELGDDVWAALTDEGRFILFEASANYGALGAFETTDLAGEALSHEIFKDAALTIVNFWGTYCPPCIEEMPIMGKLAGEYKDKDVQFLGVVIDAYDADTIDLALQIIDQTGANYRHIRPMISQEVLSSIQYVPTTMFLDEQGHQVGELEVGGLDEAGWVEAIESRLEILGKQ